MNKKYISDFSGNTLERLKRASLFLRENPGTELVIPPGDYVVSTEFSKHLMDDVLSGKMTQNPQDVIFTPYYPYDCAFTLNGAKNVKINAHGARFLIQGFMQAVEILDCENVEISGLTTDYLTKPFSVGTTVNETKDYIDVEFYNRYRVTAMTPSPRIVFFDRGKNRFSPEVMESFEKEQIGERTVRYHSANGALKNSLNKETVVIHTYHYRPNFLICDSKNVNIKEVTIHAQCGMGVLAHRCENIFIDGLNIIPSEGMPISTNTDSTHFTSCKGTIELKNSVFSGSEDDVINVHNYYYSIENIHGCRADLKVKAPDFTHAQIVDYPDTGDTLALIDKKTLKKLKSFTVVDCTVDKQRLCACAMLNEPLQINEQSCWLINETRSPDLVFTDNIIEYGLARGALIKCKRAAVTNCLFKNITGTAIHVAPESWWHEGGSADLVRIKSNRFLNTGFGTYARFKNASAVCVEAQCEDPSAPVHGEIIIEDNFIKTEFAELGIYVSNANSVILNGNQSADIDRLFRIEKCKTLNGIPQEATANTAVPGDS